VHHTFEADTFFPEIDLNKWELKNSEFHDTNENHKYTFAFETYIKKE
jgi:dihydrofolate reductase